MRPAADAVAICQNRSGKRVSAPPWLPHGPYADIRSEDDIREANAGLFPGILKVAPSGYDGKGSGPALRVARKLSLRSAR